MTSDPFWADHEPPPRELGITWPQVRRFLRRYLWLVLGVFAVVVVGGYASLSLVTEQYEARAALLVKVGRENLDAPPTTRNTLFSTGLRREEVASEVRILTSVDLIAEAVDAIGINAFKAVHVMPDDLLGQAKFHIKAAIRFLRDQYHEALIALDLEKRLDARAQAITLLSDRLMVEASKDSDLIQMRLRLANPTLAVQVHERIIEHYLARRIQVRQQPGVREFLDAEASERGEALQRAEEARNLLKAANDLTVPAEQKALLLKQIRDLEAQRSAARSEADTLVRQIVIAQQMASESSETIDVSRVETANQVRQMLREQLTKLEADRAHLATKYQTDATPIENVDAEIASIRALLDGQSATELGSATKQLNPLRQQLLERAQVDRVRLEGIRAAIAAHTNQLSAYRSELLRLEEADAQLQVLERERNVSEEQYLAMLKRREEASFASQLDLNQISNVSIVTPPHAIFEPVYPRKLLIMAILMPAGLLIGLALAFIREWARDDIDSPEALKAVTRLPLLGVVRFSDGECRP